jgi:ABC-type transport system involved in cytochrome c biogenesis permease subunit
MLHRITLLWFAASYGLALALELAHLFHPRRLLRYAAVCCGAAGLLAHTLFLLYTFFLAGQAPRLSSQFGTLLFLAWILTIFYVYGALHHGRTAWGVFVLPVVLGLVGLAAFFPPGSDGLVPPEWWNAEQFWNILHGVLMLLASVGVCVGFVASLMYLMQSYRLRAKVPPGQGAPLLSLERLEAMNRRAIALAFPLLTAGVLVGTVQLLARPDGWQGWSDPRILGAAGLWVVFVLLLSLRYSHHLRGRRAALLTIVAFVLLLFTLVASHTVSGQRTAPASPPTAVGG